MYHVIPLCCICLKRDKKLRKLHDIDIFLLDYLSLEPFVFEQLKSDIPLNICSKCWQFLRKIRVFQEKFTRTTKRLINHVFKLKEADTSISSCFNNVSVDLSIKHKPQNLLKDSFSLKEADTFDLSCCKNVFVDLSINNAAIQDNLVLDKKPFALVDTSVQNSTKNGLKNLPNIAQNDLVGKNPIVLVERFELVDKNVNPIINKTELLTCTPDIFETIINIDNPCDSLETPELVKQNITLTNDFQLTNNIPIIESMIDDSKIIEPKTDNCKIIEPMIYDSKIIEPMICDSKIIANSTVDCKAINNSYTNFKRDENPLPAPTKLIKDIRNKLVAILETPKSNINENNDENNCSNEEKHNSYAKLTPEVKKIKLTDNEESNFNFNVSKVQNMYSEPSSILEKLLNDRLTQYEPNKLTENLEIK